MTTQKDAPFTWFEMEFNYNFDTELEDVELLELLKGLEVANGDNEIKKYIKEIVDLYKKNVEENIPSKEIKIVILELFTKYSSKKVLKKFLQDVIGKSNLTNCILKIASKDLLESVNNIKCCDIKQCIDLLNFIYIMQNSPKFEYEDTIEYIFPFYCLVFEGFHYHMNRNLEKVSVFLDELITLMNAVFKQILAIFVKKIKYLEVVAEQFSAKLVVLTHAIMMHENIGFDLKTKAGLIFVHSLNIIPEEQCKNFKYKNCPPLEVLKDYNENIFFTLINNKMQVFQHSDNVVIIYSSILNVIPENKLFEVKINDKVLIVLLYNGLMECAKAKTTIPHIIVETSRSITQIGKYLKKVPQDLVKPLFLEGISFVWSHVEHFVDAVRNYTRLFFVDVVIAAEHHKNNGYEELVDILLEMVMQSNSTQAVRFLAFENIATQMSCSFLLQHFPDIQENLLGVISEPTISDQVCKTYIVCMEKHYREAEFDDWVGAWVMPAAKLLKTCNQCTSVCHRIITSAFQLNPTILKIIFPNEYIGNSQESAILLKCLQNASQNSIELSVDKKDATCVYWRGLIDCDKLNKFMVHQDEEIRLAALTVIVESQKSTQSFTEWEFQYLITFLRYNLTTQIPNVRKRVVTYYKKMLCRFKAGFNVIERTISTTTKRLKVVDETLTKEKKQEAARSLKMQQGFRKVYKCFIQKFTKFLVSSLTFDASYSRRSVSLDLLISIQEFLPYQEWKMCWNEDDIKNCHNILFDSYESNKRMAVTLLKYLPPCAIGFTSVEFTFKYMQRCLNMALDIKPSTTLSAAYLLEVCAFSPYFYDIVQYGHLDSEQRKAYNPILDMLVVLTGKLIAQSNVKMDVTNLKTSHYGIILALRHLLENRDLTENNDAYSGLFEHIATLCLDLKVDIMPIVCNPSPEGYLPDLENEVVCENDESAKAQTVLVYAWRTMKEMTLLLAEIVKQAVRLENELEMLPRCLLKKITTFFVDIFVQSKHRGVFEQAHVGFSVVCESFWISLNETLKSLPRTLLQDVLCLCTGEKDTEICATRRSAGIPFLILSILTTEPTFDKPNFHHAMKTLLKSCENLDPNYNKYRTHCMNVLRALFRHSKLGEAVSSYIASGVIVAVTGFKSESWGVRNSATLLYSALMTRMFGVQRTHESEDVCMKNKLTVRVFFLRYPELFQFLLDTLTEESKKSDSLTLHPVLMILARLYPSHINEYNTQMEKYLPHVCTCLSHPVYRTRELAARASLPLIQVVNIQNYMDMIFDKIEKSEIRDNECQGLLLQVYHILKTYKNHKEYPLSIYLQKGMHLLRDVGKKFSHMTVSLYMEVILSLLLNFPSFDDLDTLKTILSLLSKQMGKKAEISVTSLSKFSQNLFLLALNVIVNKFEECEATFPTVTNQIMTHLYGFDFEMKRFCMELLIHLNQVQNDMNQKHPLYMTGELETPQEIETLVSTLDKTSVEKILTYLHPYVKCFLTEELKFRRYIRKEDQVILFILVNCYPCVIKYLNLSKQETLNTLVFYCNTDDERLITTVISLISTFLLQLDYSVLRYDKLIQILIESSSPAASIYQRMAVCEFLSNNYILFCNEEPILCGEELQMVLNLVMILLEDDDLIVRNAMSNFSTTLKVRMALNKDCQQMISGHRWPVIPEKSKEDLLNLSCLVLQKDRAICFALSWACRHFPDPTSDTSEIFERSELNQYAENVGMMEHCIRILHRLLWPLEDGLSYEDKSIFIEEQTLIVTTVLLDSLLKNPSPMMLYKTKVSVICALKSTVKFLERCQINSNFPTEFKVYLNETILGYLSKHVDHSDLFSVKKVIKSIFEPVLNHKLKP